MPGLQLVRLAFIAAQFQCGAEAPLAEFYVDLYKDQQIVQTVELGQTASVWVQYPIQVQVGVRPKANTDCIDFTSDIILGEFTAPDQLPNVPALYEQNGVSSYFGELTDSEGIILGEFGCGSSICDSADWQDVVIRIDYDAPPAD